MFKKAKWIWINKENYKDEYGHFRSFIQWKKGKVNLNISCDGDYTIYVNGEIASFGQYPDYPHYKVYQEIDLTSFLNLDEMNTVDIIVWHYGIETSQTYYPATPGVIFEISNNEDVLDYSSSNTLSKVHDHFISYEGKMITKQLGLSFSYDAKREKIPFQSSYVVDKSYKFFKKAIKDLVRKGRLNSTLFHTKTQLRIFDLGRQAVGFLDLDFYTPKDQKIVIAFGENLENEQVNYLIHDRDFSVTYYAKEGHNQFKNYFRRLGCRYLQVYSEIPIEVNYIGLDEVEYPVKNRKKIGIELSDLRQKIYNTSVQTLKNCMHDHYEDSPWREQALYTLDSRNQMLCGYYAFEDYEYARANCLLISKGLREDGLLDICFPSKMDMTIPLYSLVYPVQIYEYILHSGDKTILKEVYSVLEKIMKTFVKRIDDQNLIREFENPYWNFYEWSLGSHNDHEINGVEKNTKKARIYSLILNTYFLYSMKYFKLLSEWANRDYVFDEQPMRKAIDRTFYDDKEKLYRLDNYSSHYSVLGNSLVILADITSRIKSKHLTEEMRKNDTIIPITLSMKCYYYDALLKTNYSYNDYVLDDLDNDYGYMLEQGATTFWETIKGKTDFDGAGSLCHGWSAMPIYYYHRLLS